MWDFFCNYSREIMLLSLDSAESSGKNADDISLTSRRHDDEESAGLYDKSDFSTDHIYCLLEQNINGSLQYIPQDSDTMPEFCPSSTDSLLRNDHLSLKMTEGGATCGVQDTHGPTDLSTSHQFSFSSTPRKNKMLLVAIGFVNLFAATSFSLLGPFFPQKATEKGVSQTVVGLIFGVFELVSFISSPVFGNYITSIGPRFMFTAGIMVSGVCTILFGVLADSPRGYPFVLLCFLTRSLDALGTSALATSSYAVLAYTFPRYLATVVGYLEMFTGVGMMVGPAVGGALYSVGGYGLPFYIIGSVQFFSGFIGLCVMPSSHEAKQPAAKSVLYLLRSPVAVISGICVINATYGYTFLEATLAQHIAQFSLSPLYISLVFLVAPTLYAIVTPFWGWLSDAKNQVFSLVIVGCVTSSLVFVFIGPSPFLAPYLSSSLWLVVSALVLMGIFYGPAIIPLFTALFLGARSLDMPDDVDTYGVVSGYFNACFSLGAFLGPICGSALMDVTSFSTSALLCAGLFLTSALLIVVYISTKRGCGITEPGTTIQADDTGSVIEMSGSVCFDVAD